MSAGRYSEFMLIANSTLGLLAGGSPVDVLMPRLNCGADKLWARCWNVTNGADIDFFIGLHEYDA